MKKTVRLTETELASLIKKMVKESDFTVEPNIETSPRERDVKSVFGKKYGAYIPMDVLRYLRKNPALVFKRLYDIYGDKSYEYLDKAKGSDDIMESHDGGSRYMFFSNLEQMRRQCDLLLDLDEGMVEGILENGHDWAQDHISEAKNNMDQVFDFMMNESKKDGMELSMDIDDKDMVMMEGRKKPGTKLCARGKAAAKSKFDVYPSAYANGYAVQVCKGTKPGLDGKKRCSAPYC
jgi:hypothetical protein